jgi:hypothetical protein
MAMHKAKTKVKVRAAKPLAAHKAKPKKKEKAMDEEQRHYSYAAAGGGGDEHDDDSSTGTTGAAEDNKFDSQGGDDEEEEVELPKEMFPNGKTEDDYKQENYDPKSEFPPGDASKGMPNYDEIAAGKQQFIAFRDYRAYLVSQAVKNERANDEFQARFVKNQKKAAAAIGVLLNPDFQRDTSIDHMEAQSMTAEQWKTYIENFRERRAEEQKEQGVPGSGGPPRHKASAAD